METTIKKEITLILNHSAKKRSDALGVSEDKFREITEYLDDIARDDVEWSQVVESIIRKYNDGELVVALLWAGFYEGYMLGKSQTFDDAMLEVLG